MEAFQVMALAVCRCGLKASTVVTSCVREQRAGAEASTLTRLRAGVMAQRRERGGSVV